MTATDTTKKTHPNTNVPVTDHLYEAEPRKGDQRACMVQASHGKRPLAAELSAVGFAEGLLAEHPELTSVAIYHTYPNAGPVRRFVREVKPS